MAARKSHPSNLELPHDLIFVSQGGGNTVHVLCSDDVWNQTALCGVQSRVRWNYPGWIYDEPGEKQQEYGAHRHRVCSKCRARLCPACNGLYDETTGCHCNG